MKVKVNNRVRNENIRDKTNAIDGGYRVEKLKFKSYAGHVMRMGEQRWVKRVINWRPLDRMRRTGRPALRWRDDDLEKIWNSDGKDSPKTEQNGEMVRARGGVCPAIILCKLTSMYPKAIKAIIIIRPI